MKYRIVAIGLATLLVLVSVAPTALAQEVVGNRLIIGRSFTLRSGETLVGSLAVLGGSVDLQHSSAVRGDIAVFGGNLNVAGAITGDVVLFGGSALLRESAVVTGDIGVFGGAVRREPGAVVTGEVTSGPTAPIPWWPRRGPESVPLPLTGPDVTWPNDVLGILSAILLWQLITLAWVIGLALLGAIIVSAAPQAMGRMATQAAVAPFASFGIGLLTLVIGFLLGLLLLIACCSGVLVWLALVIAGLIGWLAVGLWLGQRLLQALRVRRTNAIGEVALGVAMITVLARLPWCIGFLFVLVLGCTGLGAVVLTRFGAQPPEMPVRPQRDVGRNPTEPEAGSEETREARQALTVAPDAETIAPAVPESDDGERGSSTQDAP